MNRPRVALVVEDDPLSLELVTDLLSDAGWTVRQARQGDVGLASALADPPDVVLLDIGLPGKDGHWVMRALRADIRTSKVTVIAITAQAMYGSAEAALAQGFDGYLVKPIDTKAFVAEITRIIEQRLR